MYFLNQLKKRKGDFWLSVEQCAIQQGCIYAITGENGAGKSTLMNLLALMESPSQGGIYFNGKLINPREPQDIRFLGTASGICCRTRICLRPRC